MALLMSNDPLADGQQRVSPAPSLRQAKRCVSLTNGAAPGGVEGWEQVGEGTVVAEVAAGGADEDAVVNPAADPHADAEQLTPPHAQEGAVLNEHRQALSGARHLEEV